MASRPAWNGWITFESIHDQAAWNTAWIPAHTGWITFAYSQLNAAPSASNSSLNGVRTTVLMNRNPTWKAVLIAFHTVENTCPTTWKAVLIAFHTVENTCPTTWKPVCNAPHTVWKTGTTYVWNHVTTTLTAFWMPAHAVETMFRPVSVWVKNHVNAVTAAPTAVTVNTNGLAFMATFNTDCAAAAAVEARLNPLSALTAAVISVAALNAANPPAIDANAPATIPEFCDTQPLTRPNAPAALSTRTDAPWNALPTTSPKALASPDSPASAPNRDITSLNAPPRLFPASTTTPNACETVCNAPVFLNAAKNPVTLFFATSNTEENRSRVEVRNPLSVVFCDRPFHAPENQSVKSVTLSLMKSNAPVNCGLTLSRTVMPSFWTAASQLPIAPSNVAVDSAAFLATSSMPSWSKAWLNSSAEIWPFSMASRKSPVYAPLSFMAFCSLPDAPGMASAIWFQFSVVSLPAPAVCVNAMATLLYASAPPPATAVRLPAASASLA